MVAQPLVPAMLCGSTGEHRLEVEVPLRHRLDG